MRIVRTHSLALTVGVASLGLAATWAHAEDYGPFKEQKTKAGDVLADTKGMTLYTYDKDKSGESACTGKCAEAWPPAEAKAGDKPSGDFTTIKRPDGTMQWARGGKPLYTFQGDKKAGDTTGDGKGDVWHVAKPD